MSLPCPVWAQLPCSQEAVDHEAVQRRKQPVGQPLLQKDAAISAPAPCSLCPASPSSTHLGKNLKGQPPPSTSDTDVSRLTSSPHHPLFAISHHEHTVQEEPSWAAALQQHCAAALRHVVREVCVCEPT